MKTIQRQEFLCTRCMHYIQHYVKSGMRLVPVEGHCANRSRPEGKGEESLKPLPACKYFEQSPAVTVEDRDEKILQLLTELKDYVADIDIIVRHRRMSSL
ncbi:MAG: hypothetical protein K2I79_02370 [Clostridia bacterium]|nr:hypothetical protein [Clostridia bacterium]